MVRVAPRTLGVNAADPIEHTMNQLLRQPSREWLGRHARARERRVEAHSHTHKTETVLKPFLDAWRCRVYFCEILEVCTSHEARAAVSDIHPANYPGAAGNAEIQLSCARLA